jgi:hypothetical protein
MPLYVSDGHLVYKYIRIAVYSLLGDPMLLSWGRLRPRLDFFNLFERSNGVIRTPRFKKIRMAPKHKYP